MRQKVSASDISEPFRNITFRYLNICVSKLVGEKKSKNLWSGCEILANFSYNFHSELWTFGTLILGSLNKKGPKSGKVTTMGTYFANLKVCDCDPLCSSYLRTTTVDYQ